MRDRPIFKGSGKWLIGLATLAAFGLAGLGYFTYSVVRSPADQPATAPAPTPSPRQSITALGRIEPKDGVYRVAAPSSDSDRVVQVLVKQGDRVKAGQVIAIMDNGERLQAAAIEAQAQVAEAERRLAQVQAGAKTAEIDAERANVDRLRAELENANREFQRYEALYRSGAISASDLDSRRLTLETTARQVEQAQRTLESVREVRPVDVDLAESQVQVAVARLQKAQADLQNAIVRAPINGQVIRVHADPGEAVGTDGILELGDTSQMYVIAEVYETDVRTIRVGQQAEVNSSAFPQVLTGKVERVGLEVNRNDVLSSDPTADIDTRVVEVKIRLDNGGAPVAGMTNLQVNVAIDNE